MTPKKLAGYQSLVEYINKQKHFLTANTKNPHILDGIMKLIGYRVASTLGEAGVTYINSAAIRKDPFGCLKVNEYGSGLDEFLANLYEPMAHNLLQEASLALNKTDTPIFNNKNIEEGINNPYKFASALSFTYNLFFNQPHTDKNDLLEHSFGLWIPTFLGSGEIATHADAYDLKGGEFYFPDYKFRVDFSKCDGACKIIWAERLINHCTLAPVSNSKFDQLGMSLQMNKKTNKFFGDLKADPKKLVKDGTFFGNVETRLVKAWDTKQ